MANKRKFTWDKWAFDGEEDCYVIAKDQCISKGYIPRYIQDKDGADIASEYESYAISEGWCKYQVRRDWLNAEGDRLGGYCVLEQEKAPTDLYGKKMRGWFPVWIVRLGIEVWNA